MDTDAAGSLPRLRASAIKAGRLDIFTAKTRSTRRGDSPSFVCFVPFVVTNAS